MRHPGLRLVSLHGEAHDSGFDRTPEGIVFAPLAIVYALLFVCISYKSISIIRAYKTVRRSLLLLSLYIVVDLCLLTGTMFYVGIVFSAFAESRIAEDLVGVIMDVLAFMAAYLFFTRLLRKMARSQKCGILLALYYGCWAMLFGGLSFYTTVRLLDIFGMFETEPATLMGAVVYLVSFLYMAAMLLAVTRELLRRTGTFLLSSERLLSAFFVCKMCGMLEGCVFPVFMMYYAEITPWMMAAYEYSLEMFDQLLPGVLIFAMIYTEVLNRKSRRDNPSTASSPLNPSLSSSLSSPSSTRS